MTGSEVISVVVLQKKDLLKEEVSELMLPPLSGVSSDSGGGVNWTLQDRLAMDDILQAVFTKDLHISVKFWTLPTLYVIKVSPFTTAGELKERISRLNIYATEFANPFTLPIENIVLVGPKDNTIFDDQQRMYDIYPDYITKASSDDDAVEYKMLVIPGRAISGGGKRGASTPASTRGKAGTYSKEEKQGALQMEIDVEKLKIANFTGAVPPEVQAISTLLTNEMQAALTEEASRPPTKRLMTLIQGLPLDKIRAFSVANASTHNEITIGTNLARLVFVAEYNRVQNLKKILEVGEQGLNLLTRWLLVKAFFRERQGMNWNDENGFFDSLQFESTRPAPNAAPGAAPAAPPDVQMQG